MAAAEKGSSVLGCLEKQKAVCLVQVLGQGIFSYFTQKSPLLFVICFSAVNLTKT